MKRRKHEPCDFCDGRLAPREVRVVRERKRKLVVIEDVPAWVCGQCGMRYYDAAVVRRMEEIVRDRKTRRRTLRVPVAQFEGVA